MLLNNSTIFSVLKIILNYQNYRVAYFYTTELTNDFSSKIPELAWDHMIPVTQISFDKIQSFNRNKCEEPILNVFLINNWTDTNSTELKKLLLPNDVTVILLTSSPDTNVEQLKFNIWAKLCFKVLILWKSGLMSLNQFLDKIDRIAIQPYDGRATKRFVVEYLSDDKTARGAKMTIFIQHTPTKSWIGPVFGTDDFSFNGAHGIISDILYKTLNVTPTYVSDVANLNPRFYQWRSASIVVERSSYYKYHKQATTSNIISVFNTTVNSSMDFRMSPQFLEPDYIDDSFNLSTERLYPHDTECLRVFVPQQLKIQTFLAKIINDTEIQCIGIILLIFVSVRIVIRRAFWNEWFSITFSTLQLFLVQGQIVNRNTVEAAWTIILRWYSLFAIITMSLALYKSLMKVHSFEIDTVADLIASNLTIFVPKSLTSHFDGHYNELQSQLRKKMVFSNEAELGGVIVTSGSTCAYVCYEAKAQFLLRMNTLYGNGVTGRIMKEKLFCKLTSYRIGKSLPFKRITNDILRRCIENGLYYKTVEWGNDFYNAMFKTNQTDPQRDAIVVKMEIISSVFICYLAGMLLSFIFFIIEVSLCLMKKKKQ